MVLSTSWWTRLRRSRFNSLGHFRLSNKATDPIGYVGRNEGRLSWRPSLQERARLSVDSLWHPHVPKRKPDFNAGFWVLNGIPIAIGLAQICRVAFNSDQRQLPLLPICTANFHSFNFLHHFINPLLTSAWLCENK